MMLAIDTRRSRNAPHGLGPAVVARVGWGGVARDVAAGVGRAVGPSVAAAPPRAGPGGPRGLGVSPARGPMMLGFRSQRSKIQRSGVQFPGQRSRGRLTNSRRAGQW